jgi:hypothetical protein
VPLGNLARITPTANLLAVNHQGQFPSVTLSFNTAPNVALGEAVEAVRQAEAEVGLPARIQASFSGTAQAYKDSLASEPYLILSDAPPSGAEPALSFCLGALGRPSASATSTRPAPAALGSWSAMNTAFAGRLWPNQPANLVWRFGPGGHRRQHRGDQS